MRPGWRVLSEQRSTQRSSARRSGLLKQGARPTFQKLQNRELPSPHRLLTHNECIALLTGQSVPILRVFGSSMLWCRSGHIFGRPVIRRAKKFTAHRSQRRNRRGFQLAKAARERSRRFYDPSGFSNRQRAFKCRLKSPCLKKKNQLKDNTASPEPAPHLAMS